MMSQPEESREKTAETDDVVLRPGQDPLRRTAQIKPRPEEQRGQVRVERDGQLRPVDTQAAEE
jgi:uncharacterized membrane protein